MESWSLKAADVRLGEMSFYPILYPWLLSQMKAAWNEQVSRSQGPFTKLPREKAIYSPLGQTPGFCEALTQQNYWTNE